MNQEEEKKKYRNTIYIRVNDEQLKALKTASANNKLSRSEFVRLLISKIDFGYEKANTDTRATA